MANGRFEAKVMHGLMGAELTYEQIMNMRATWEAESQRAPESAGGYGGNGEEVDGDTVGLAHRTNN